VPTYESVEHVRALLEALSAQSSSESTLPVVVSDDASPQPVADRLGNAFEGIQLEVVRSATNGGPGAARNRALERVRTDWVAFLDADEVPGAEWLATATRLTATTAADGFEGRVVIPAESVSPFTHATESEFAHLGGNVVYRTELLRAAGGFDERFFDPARKLHFREDLELFFRLQRAGATIVYEPALIAHHPPLERSLLSPLRLARRYYFDPLLSREHPQAFRDFGRTRKLGPVSLRRARHLAALLLVGATAVLAAGLALGSLPVVLAGAAALIAAWAANGVALAYRRSVRAADVPPLALVALLVPWVYLWHYYRGVLAFRHRPRL
jgi:GT2 family glycosyltransferase